MDFPFADLQKVVNYLRGDATVKLVDALDAALNLLKYVVRTYGALSGASVASHIDEKDWADKLESLQSEVSSASIPVWLAPLLVEVAKKLLDKWLAGE